MLEEMVSVICFIFNFISIVIVLKCDEKDIICFGIFWFLVLIVLGFVIGGVICFFVICR